MYFVVKPLEATKEKVAFGNSDKQKQRKKEDGVQEEKCKGGRVRNIPYNETVMRVATDCSQSLEI